MKKILPFCLLFLSFSCKKEEISPDHLLIMHRWERTSLQITTPDKVTTEQLTLPCQKDDLYIFGAGYSFIIVNRESCNTSEYAMFYDSYALRNNRLTILNEPREIKELNKKRMVLFFTRNDTVFTETFKAIPLYK
ncbi:hypothetical protein [Adhaeribacter aquaticus]|uniref:hypothetical protein n=1 Tax=Adhaeribacter aquaticus TaxID=299567 RepID=UPI0003F861DF|nr:hypothetical protein [Adhaeribacter aquaticus]